jgi:hypothetical protein
VTKLVTPEGKSTSIPPLFTVVLMATPPDDTIWYPLSFTVTSTAEPR